MYLRQIFEYLFGKKTATAFTPFFHWNKHTEVEGRRNRKRNPIISGLKRIDDNQVINKRIPSHVRDGVWLKYHGANITGSCYCCGKIIEKYYAGWHCSHVVARDKGGQNTIENLRPCCAGCNLSMGDCNLYKYIIDKNLGGPGVKNIEKYRKVNPKFYHDRRT